MPDSIRCLPFPIWYIVSARVSRTWLAAACTATGHDTRRRFRMDRLMPTGGIGKKMEPTYAFRIISDTCIPQHTHLALHYASRLPRTRSLGNGWSHIFTVMSHLRRFLFFYHHSVVANHDFSSRDEGLQTPPESLGSIHRRAHSSMCCRCEGPKTMMHILLLCSLISMLL